jgi:protein-disulfide isomerase
MRSHSWTLTLAVVLGIAQGCAAPGEGSPPASSTTATSAPNASAPTDSLLALGDRSRILGDSSAPVWVVIVSDFQCPYCKVWHDQTYPALKREFVDKGEVRLAYLNLPLPQHQHARVTAELAFCAGAQGRFWEYHDALFDTQSVWSQLPAGTQYFDSLATRAGVDLTRLRSCMTSQAMQPLVEADFQRGMEAKVRSTPTFMIGNDVRLEGAQPIEAFRQAIATVRTAAKKRPGNQ